MPPSLCHSWGIASWKAQIVGLMLPRSSSLAVLLLGYDVGCCDFFPVWFGLAMGCVIDRVIYTILPTSNYLHDMKENIAYGKRLKRYPSLILRSDSMIAMVDVGRRLVSGESVAEAWRHKHPEQ